ncbi:hypothetical protein A4X13_0g3415 [Tilletia indica]|uniref:DNA 3'-5' helicase n=1 Tax=Tilletia indica TaxID=43049 RepID=A0A177TF46_9BASI|nr:hypothetical protein A4X13_0g3415 [Tilletia indica]
MKTATRTHHRANQIPHTSIKYVQRCTAHRSVMTRKPGNDEYSGTYIGNRDERIESVESGDSGVGSRTRQSPLSTREPLGETLAPAQEKVRDDVADSPTHTDHLQSSASTSILPCSQTPSSIVQSSPRAYVCATAAADAAAVLASFSHQPSSSTKDPFATQSSPSSSRTPKNARSPHKSPKKANVLNRAQDQRDLVPARLGKILGSRALLALVCITFRDQSLKPHDWQMEACYQLLAGRDGLVSAGTGSGKTMIWILLALALLNANLLIISPLKSLQEEQARKLRRIGISAIAVNEDTLKPRKASSGSGTDVLSMIRLNRVRVVFVSPESLFKHKSLAQHLFEGAWSHFLAAIVVDEAHVVYDWGLALGRSKGSAAPTAFRPEYGKLAWMRARVPDRVPMLAVSATLCGPCLPAICSSLGFGRRPFFALDVGRERDGCSYDIQALRHSARTFLDLAECFPAAPSVANDLPKALVYVNTRREAVDAAESLQRLLPVELRPAVASLTAIDSPFHKRALLRRLRKGTVRILVATEALGMGIDLPDVDLVIQWKLPRDFKALVQHFGRGARGRNAQCRAILLCEGWVTRMMQANLDSNVASNSSSSAKLPKLLEDRWSRLDQYLRDWMTSKCCLKVTCVQLLTLDFDIIVQSIGGSPAVHISTASIGKGPIASRGSEDRFFWRKPVTVAAPSSIHANTANAEDCCVRCRVLSIPTRKRVISVASSGITQRLVAPPLKAEFTNLRRSLSSTLATLRSGFYTSYATGPTHNWRTVRAMAISDEIICSIVDRATRLLAYKAKGGTIDQTFVETLTGPNHGLNSFTSSSLVTTLNIWASHNLSDQITLRLTPTGRLRQRKTTTQRQGPDA